MSWIEIKLAVPESLKEAVVSRLFELGAQGVDESDSSVRAFFDESRGQQVFEELPAYAESLAAISPKTPRITFEMVSVPQDNWSDRYKEHYKAQKLTSLFFLRPVWDTKTPIPDEMIPIFLDAGQAFGTGLHQSTRLSLHMIETALELYPRSEEIRFLDVGTGTGILSIGAYKLGVRKVLAIDNDPVAVETAKENLIANDCGAVKASEEPISKLTPAYDLIVSNILLETHRELRGEYKRLLAPKGKLILAGVLAQQKRELNDLMKELGFVEEIGEAMQEWACVLYSLQT